MSEWDEKAKAKQECYEAVIEDQRAAAEEYTLAENTLRLVEIRLFADVYGDGSAWTSEKDPRIQARVIENLEVIEALGRVKTAYIRLNNARAAQAIAQPRHWLGD